MPDYDVFAFLCGFATGTLIPLAILTIKYIIGLRQSRRAEQGLRELLIRLNNAQEKKKR